MLPCKVTSFQHSDGFKCLICFSYLFSYLIKSIWSLKNCHILLCRQAPRGCTELNAPSCQQWLLDAARHSCYAATRTDRSSPPEQPPPCLCPSTTAPLTTYALFTLKRGADCSQAVWHRGSAEQNTRPCADIWIVNRNLKQEKKMHRKWNRCINDRMTEALQTFLYWLSKNVTPSHAGSPCNR